MLKNEFYEEKYNRAISNIISQGISILFLVINNDLGNTLNLKQQLNKKTKILSISKRAKSKFALKYRDVGILNWEKSFCGRMKVHLEKCCN